MTKRLIADGVTGRVAIMEGGSRHAFDSPSDHMDKIYFHSDLDYLSIVQKAYIAGVYMPPIQAGYTERVFRDGKKGTYVFTEPKIVQGVRTYVVANVLGDLNGPVITLYQGRPVTGPLLLCDISSSETVSGGAVIPTRAYRSVGFGISGGTITVTETYLSIGGGTVPGYTLNDVVALKLNLGSANPTSAESLHIEPTLFIASKGKLDSRLRYLARSASPDTYLLPGRTMDLSNGGVRYANSDGANTVTDTGPYEGSWWPSQPIGIQI
jgi:hypothetical protein